MKKNSLKIKFLAIILFAFTIFGCAGKYEIPNNIPNFTQAVFQIKENSKTNILLISKKGEKYYFLYQNSFGMPICKKSFSNGEFKNEGFYMPNSKAKKLFIKVLNMIQNEKEKILNLDGQNYEIRQISIS